MPGEQGAFEQVRQVVGRQLQQAYNDEHGITPTTIVKSIDDVAMSVYTRDYSTVEAEPEPGETFRSQAEVDAAIARLQQDMRAAAANLEFEKAAGIRDEIRRLRTRVIGVG